MTFSTEISKWWPRLPEPVRAQIVANPRAPLTADAINAVTEVRGVGPAGAYWAEGSAAPRFYFTDAEVEWIESLDG